MKAILRSSVFAAALASTVALSTGAQAATAALVFTGTASIDCFGCGTTHCEADLTVTGLPASGGAHAECTANEPGGSLCLLTGTASGHVDGSGGLAGFGIDFNWTRAGAVAVITVSGDTTGAGVAAFLTTGVSCGAAVSATVAGSIAGV